MSDTQLPTTTTRTATVKPPEHIQAASDHKLHERLKHQLHDNHPRAVLDAAEKELDEVEQVIKQRSIQFSEYPNYFKALTLHEFDTGILLAAAVPVSYKAFTVDLAQKYREEFGCTTASQMTLCEIAAVAYVRILETSRLLNNVTQVNDGTRLALDWVEKYSKELDRADRQFRSALQDLSVGRRSPVKMTVNVKGPANIAHNQQVNNTEEVIRPNDFGGGSATDQAE